MFQHSAVGGESSGTVRSTPISGVSDPYVQGVISLDPECKRVARPSSSITPLGHTSPGFHSFSTVLQRVVLILVKTIAIKALQDLALRILPSKADFIPHLTLHKLATKP